jgi:probable rRNA maturation factor
MPTAVVRRASGSPPLATSQVRRLGDRVLAALELEHAELSVLLTNDATIHALNHRHRGKDRPTDVLAFPLATRRMAGLPRLLGDVVISLDTAARQARGRQRELFAEVRFLLVHGVLHLLGYDHGTRSEKREMDAMARRILRDVTRDTAKATRHPRRAARAGHAK